jgi:hypothetical protein
MWPRARLRTSLLSLAAIAAIVVALVAGTGGSAADPPCGAATDSTYLSTALTVALRISAAERTGVAVERAVDTIEADRVLAQAVASGDLATVHSEVHALVYNHQHVVRLRVLRGGQVLDDVGGPLVLSPVSGSLRLHGQVVGTFVMSVQDDLGYRLLAQRLIGAHTVMRYQDRTIMSNISVGSAPLPDRGSVIVGTNRYLVASFAMGRFPTGELRVSLLMRRPAAALAHQSCAQVRADALAGIAQRAYGEAKTGPSAEPARTAVARALTLPAALAAGDDAAVAGILNTLVGAGGFARLRVVAGGRVVADSAARGAPSELVAPTSRALVDAGGRVVGHAVFAVQSARGYSSLGGYLTHAPVLLRAGTRQIAGPFPGPATLPPSGPITYLGVHYVVASFPGVLFPNGPMTVYVLGPA